MLLLFALASCSPRYGIAERGSRVAIAHVDKTTSATRDTVILAQKVRFVKMNDTVYRDSFVVLKEIRTRIDTIIKADSVLVTDTLNVITFRDPRSWFQKTTDKAGNICLLVIFIIIIVKLLKLKRHD